MAGMRRRDFIAAAGSTAVGWPLAVRAQQAAMPVIGFLSGRSFDDSMEMMTALGQGLNEQGFAEHQNLKSNTAGQTDTTTDSLRSQPI